MKKLMLLMGFVLIGLGISAQTTKPKLVKQRVMQNQRIQEGKISGNLTKKEVKQLKRQQKAVNRTVRIAQADGVVSRKEKAVIAKKNQRVSINIYRQKHDQQVCIK